MSSPSAVGDLLAALSYRLENGNRAIEEELNESSSSMGRAISELNRSLTLDTNGEDSGFSVLDATVSLMCFKAPQVFDSVVEFLVKTIVSVLSCSSSCKVIRYHNDEALQFGSLSLPHCSEELIEISKDIIDKLGVNGGFDFSFLSLSLLFLVTCLELFVGRLATLLFQAVVRSAASTSRKLAGGRNMVVSKLLAYLPRESSIENDKIPLRILFWYQDPLSLKEDVSRILKDLVERPFLCLNKELFERGEWRDVVVCLALSPSMFINARALLHKWFLLTGLASVFDLLAALVSAVVDTVSRPTLWGIPMELASMLPFSDAYFPHQCQFLRILAGPLTSNSLVTLAHSCKPTPIKVQALDDKTEWALAINFPDWFYFASAMLFSGGSSLENIHHRYASHSQVSNIIPPCGVEGLSVAAATYIAWILNPASGTIQESLTKSLIRVSEMLRRSETTTGKRKKPASSIVDDLVREFHNKITNSFSCELDNMQNNLLVRRVVVGVLICSPYTVTDEEYELVLHYAATGKHLAVKKLRFNGFKQAKGSSKTSMLQSNEITKEEAVEGTRLVFNLTDTLESMCASSFEAEEDAHEFINQFKLRSSKYLVKCIDRMIQLHCEEDGDLILNDINIRLEQWSMKGPEDPQLKEDLDTIAAKLAFIFSPV
ncbi:uncharacterized protein LOC103862891 isoform X1 [Brassica rapa]|uniref:uncharacterized protein LOC103862891 isoform X1 n=1 Tax=Brassica campestris TaxID=3711 RepID=UPI0004F175F3|nr:uncharacterized protein LOC103862891 isoform X1 [Brassica rapa]